MNREEWLSRSANAIAEEILGPIEDLGYNAVTGDPLVEKLNVSVGWPSARAMNASGRSLGQCFSPTASKSGMTEIFISPVVDDTDQALGILVHELIHAAVGTDKKHGPEFGRACVKAGLVGSPMSNVPGPDLATKLRSLVSDLGIGEYPHAALDHPDMVKQTTRLLKAVCRESDCPSAEDGGYTVRVTKRWALEGEPRCGICGARMYVAETAVEVEDEEPA